MSTLAQVILNGLYSARPSPSVVGRLYFTSDTSQIYYDTGSAWNNVTPASTVVTDAIQQQSYVYAADSGTANALAVSLTPTPTIVAGSLVVVLVAHTNTGASTIAVNGGSATAITKDGTTALTGGELTAGQIVFLVYDGTEYQLIGGSGSGGSGTVTSVALTVPSRQSVSGSPITSSGTLAITDNTQSANKVFAGPSSGSAAAPTFRSLVSADLPVATTSQLGAVEPDGTTITISGGVISASGGSPGALVNLGNVVGWSGGTFSGNTFRTTANVASIGISSIPSTYTNLVIVFSGGSTYTIHNYDGVGVQLNTSTGGSYNLQSAYANSSSGTSGIFNGNGVTGVVVVGIVSQNGGGTNTGVFTLRIPFYALSGLQTFFSSAGAWSGYGVADAGVFFGGGNWNNTTPLTGITLSPLNGPDFTIGTTVAIYGEM